MAIKTDLSSIAAAICVSEGLNFISEAGMGEFKHTFHVQDKTGTSFALKIFFQGTSGERQSRELSAMQRCGHQSIAKLFRVDHLKAKNGQDYLWTMEEFLDGGTLTVRLQNGLYDIPTGKAAGTFLIDAVSHIAALNLVHRDLKPDNIMFRKSDPTPLIVDFGLVRDLSLPSVTQSWAMQGPGTPFFASPEQLNNEKAIIDWRADQFALGIILSLSILGQHPYQSAGDSPQLVVDNVANRRSHSQDFLKLANSQGLLILERMTMPWPIQRYRDPDQLAAAWNS